MSEPSWRALHPLSVAVNLLPRTWRVARQLWPLLLAMIFGGRAGGEALVDAFLVGVFLLLTVGGTVMHWATLRYRVADGRLEIRSGLLNRQVRVLSPDRIQNLERVRNVFHRAAGLVEVRLETASGTEVEGTLSALSEADADALIAALGRARRPTEVVAEVPVVIENGPLDLARYGVTSTRLGASLVLFGVGIEVLERTGPATASRLSQALGIPGFLVLLTAILSGTWLMGAVSAVVRHHGFRLGRQEGGLVAEEGLFTRRRVELPLGKVQVVTVVEPWLRRAVGVGSVHIETAAAREGGGGTQRAEAMVPLVERDGFQRVVQAAIPALDVPLDDAPLRPPHPRALVRGLLRATLRGLTLTGLVSWWFWPWGLVSMAVVPGALWAAWLDHRAQGWMATPRVIVARKGFFSRKTWIVDRDKLQSLDVVQGPLLRRANLGELVVRVAGDAITLPMLDRDEALALQRALLRPPGDPDRPGSPATAP